MWPALLATIAATIISGAIWTDAAMILLAGVAATISGYSRPLGIAAIRFIVYLVLSVGLLDAAAEHRGVAALIFGCGALWNVGIRILLADRQVDAETPRAPAHNPTHAQRRAHLRRTLRKLSGWQFTLRLVLGLSIASVVRHVWPAHHYFWIVLTIALLTQRPLERAPTKLLERAGGAMLGVALTWAILFATLPPVVLAILVCILGTTAAVLRSRSYMLYSAVSMPVILLVLDYGKPIATALLTDRIVATLAAAAIVVVLNLLFELLGVESVKARQSSRS